MSHVALRQTLMRFRDRFRTVLRAQIADTLREPAETTIDDELRTLSAVLASGSLEHVPKEVSRSTAKIGEAACE